MEVVRLAAEKLFEWCDAFTARSSISLWYLLASPVGVVVFIYLLYLYYTPVNRVRDLSDIGFWHLKDKDKRRLTLKELANEALRRKVPGEIPPAYPNGWFSVAESRDLTCGETKPLSLLGLNLVLFRGENGQAHILDAYCPHLGAHLGVGSKVIGDCVECPFHGWRFRGNDGQCIVIPYSNKVPEFAKVKRWTTRELNGYIYLWYHAENKEPYWEPENIKEITSGSWSYRGRSEHYIRAHIQEIPENGADVAHLAQVHEANVLAGSDLRHIINSIWNTAVHKWEASWKAGEEQNSHIAYMNVNHQIKVLGKYQLFSCDVSVRQVGPALVYLAFNTPFGKAVLLHNVTPLEPILQRVTHSLYCERSMPMFMSKIIILAEAIMIERDIVIWNHKTFLHKPLLVKEDQFIGKMRRWYSQFYSENSPRHRFKKETLEW